MQITSIKIAKNIIKFKLFFDNKKNQDAFYSCEVLSNTACKMLSYCNLTVDELADVEQICSVFVQTYQNFVSIDKKIDFNV